MNRRARIAALTAAGIVLLGATAAVAGPVIYRDFIAAPPAEIPKLTADEGAISAAPDGAEAGEGDASVGSADAATAVGDLTGIWAVAAGSEAGYRVDEVLNGTDVTVTGRTSGVTGTVSVEGLSVTDATIEIDVASIATGNGNRDAYFRDQAMRVAQHPTATFALSAPITADEAPATGEAVTRTVSGELTLAGVTRAVTFDAQLRIDGDGVRIAGQVPIVFDDYGVQAPDLGFVKVEPQGFVEFDLVLQRS
ncbi:MAG: YceI family protein [Leucobacter sp.]|nr:YceI family protein [Leucobacter sp.]